MEFPIFKTKIENFSQKFDLTDSQQRKDYFQLKAGQQIEKLREFLKENSFIAYLLGKKNSGKGTYAKMVREIVDPERIEHFSVGDMIRQFDKILKDKEKKKELISFLENNYRGFLSLEEIISSLEKRSTKTLLPTELILALIKEEISKREKKALFIDGFPREMDQISFALFFRDLIGYRDDPDIFILIDVPEKVIDERIKYRVVCPLCQTSRNLKLLPTKKIGYDEKEKNFYLQCDNPECQGTRMLPKEGDEQGLAPIRERLEKDEKLIKQALSLYGIPKILLRNSVPVDKASELIDDYEITPEYSYKRKNGEIAIIEKPWKFLDDKGVLSFSLLPPPVVISLLSQLTEVLNL